MWWCLLFVYLCVSTCSTQIIYKETHKVSYPIAGIFEHGAMTQRLAFDESMRHAHLGDSQPDSASEDNSMKVKVKDLQLEPTIIDPSRPDSYSIWREMCSQKEIKPIAVVGPQNPISDGAIRDQCALDNIPHIQATWQPLDPDFDESNEEVIDGEEESTPEVTFKKISINFYPSAEEISSAYAMLLKFYNWENFAVLYEDDFGLLRVQKILAEHSDQYAIPVRKLNPEGDNNKIFKELVKDQESRIILDCHVDNIMKYIKEAQALGMLNYYQHYIILSMDTSVLADELSSLQSNITWLSITQFDQLKDPQHFLAPRVGKWINTTNSLIPPPVNRVQVEGLIMNDIANHVLVALQKVKDLEIPYSSMCEPDPEPWQYGAQLQNEILKSQTNGVTGNIEFDDKGRRVNYTLFVNEIYMKKRQTIGTWLSAQPDKITEEREETDDLSNQQSNKHFIIISSKAKPYFYERVRCPEDDEKCVEEDADENYEGFAVDLAKMIFDYLKKEKFNYTYSFSKDDTKKYGKYNPEKKKWDGLIGELLDKKADLAISDLTITEVRKKVVDFSVPFMSLGISILYTKEHKVVPGMFSFLNPYTFDVWMHTATAYCVVSIILFISSRVSPADWENPQPCDKDPEELENIWNFKNCAWLTMGSIMTQGCDILPKAIGTRWVCGMWWFFAVIVCQTYIAQLSASMTSALEIEPINSVEDLAKRNKILYGAVEGGSTLEFFRSSKDKMYRQMYDTMIANSVVLVNSNDEGEKRVLNGKNKYAFFMESCTILYKTKRNCDLKQVGEQLDSKDYGIAMPANSPFRTHINRAILKLKESSDLEQVIKKWWEEKNGAMQCVETVDENDVQGDLEMENLIGLFVVLIVGLVFCMFITAAEFMNEVRNIVVRENVTHKEVFIKELKASLNFFQLQKPVLRNPNRASTVDSDSTGKKDRVSAAIENFMDLEREIQ